MAKTAIFMVKLAQMQVNPLFLLNFRVILSTIFFGYPDSEIIFYLHGHLLRPYL